MQRSANWLTWETGEASPLVTDAIGVGAIVVIHTWIEIITR